MATNERNDNALKEDWDSIKRCAMGPGYDEWDATAPDRSDVAKAPGPGHTQGDKHNVKASNPGPFRSNPGSKKMTGY